MTAQKIAEFDFFEFLIDSILIDTKKDSRIWFIHLNLRDSKEKVIPDSGLIVDNFVSNIQLPKIQFLLILIDRKRIEYWTAKKNYVYYQEIIEFQTNNLNKINNINNHKKRGCVWKDCIDRNTLLEIVTQSCSTPLDSIAKNRNAAIIKTNIPFQLETKKISKPWGYETWYTGVEKRGVVNVLGKYGNTELPYSLNLFKKQILGNCSEELILLKKLNPYAEEVVGDLYYEMHEKKWEVYVVTNIDKSAWPKGIAIVKAGINSKKISEYKKKYGKDWSKYLIKNFKDATKKYENLRRKIDYNDFSSKSLLFQESLLRKKAVSFVGNCYVKEGDIVSFSPFQIHSLQHGIKVIEFQTPHYERLIVMFGQKVVTQNNWNSEEALEKVITNEYKPPKLKLLYKSPGILLERFVDFPNFTADRLLLSPKMTWEEKLKKHYQILIAISGQAVIINEKEETFTINIEEALFLPISMGRYYLKNTGDKPLICLKATPK